MKALRHGEIESATAVMTRARLVFAMPEGPATHVSPHKLLAVEGLKLIFVWRSTPFLLSLGMIYAESTTIQQCTEQTCLVVHEVPQARLLV